MHTRLLGMETDLIESANDMWVRLKTAVIDSAETIVQQRRGPRSRPDWMSQETWSAVLRRRTLKENGLSTEDDRRHYRELHRTVQRLCRKDKNAEVDRVCQEIEESSNRAHTKDMFCKVKSLTKDIKIKNWTLEDDTGVIITDGYKVLERWREYCRGLNAATEDSEELRMSECGVREPDIFLAEIEWAMARLKHKTSGGDRVTAQMLKNLGPKGTHMLHLICQRVWSTGRWPDDWSESILVPLHKKGSTRKCKNYRTISLLSHASKILLSIIKAKLENYIDRHISEKQAGFVKGKGTREQILNVRQLIEKNREFNVPLLMCFIDYAKAFDCVSWNRMFEVMGEMGVSEHLILLVQNLYLDGTCRVRLEDATSGPFSTKGSATELHFITEAFQPLQQIYHAQSAGGLDEGCPDNWEKDQ
ncbi:uncharacterized protein LOC112467350 [Temnothorax curvispinosus]|uniref:Uncharacterized protein LOC112467350 n=1 Tax=Temnothorax curvispinosus TaxID=300111 RepID=A0A6J1RBT0_9HYME|nr:uncharacterized protein LOC112467350 [Temnothorax curvispinosus]